MVEIIAINETLQQVVSPRPFDYSAIRCLAETRQRSKSPENKECGLDGG
jgi:hypothetical protein